MDHTSANSPPSLLTTALAFRPFFWLGSVYLLFAFTVWLLFWRGHVVLNPVGGMIWWHQHEMLFGFVCAIIVGFLLTAVQTWTGLPSVTGPALWALLLVWLSARLLLLFPMELDPLWIMALDGLFLPLVALLLAQRIIRAKKWHNLAFIPLLLLLSVANLAMHWGRLRVDPTLIQHSAYLSVWLIVCLMVLLGGRVIPFFTSKALHIDITPLPAPYEKAALLSVFAIVALYLAQLGGWDSSKGLLSAVLAVFVISHFLRLRSWQPLRCWRHPLLWSLHLSYAFIVLGAALWLAALWQWIPTGFALHSLTVGGILALILAMLARVSLGHTGRTIQALPGFSLAMVCLFIAALSRTALPWLAPSWTLASYQISLGLCLAAYAWFVVCYTLPLWTARVDHKPG